MELKELEYIVAIAEEGSISKAAQRLYMAQSSLSQYLSRSETELRTRLFVRTGAGVRLTSAGEIYVRNARQILWQYNRIRGELKETEAGSGGRILFGISSFRGAALIPPVLKRFQMEYPAAEVRITELNTSELTKKVAAGELDLALVALRPHEVQPGDPAILRDEVCLVVNRAHPVMERLHYGHPNRPWIDLKETGSFEYLLSDRSTVLGNVAAEVFAEAGIAPPVTNDKLTAAFAAEMACAGLGLAFTYRSCIVPRTDVEYVSLGESGYYVDLVLIFPPDGYRSSANRALETMIRDFYYDKNRL
jgi:Transcriptional regulator